MPNHSAICKEIANKHGANKFHNFTQRKLLEKAGSENPTAGVCQALTLLDGLVKMQGEKYNPKGLVNMAAYAETVTPKFEGGLGKFDLSVMKNKYLEIMHEFSDLKVRIGWTEALKLGELNDFIRTKKGYFNINFPGHTTGIGIRPGNLSYFEPNAGSLRFPTMDKLFSFASEYHSHEVIAEDLKNQDGFDILVIHLIST